MIAGATAAFPLHALWTGDAVEQVVVEQVVAAMAGEALISTPNTWRGRWRMANMSSRKGSRLAAGRGELPWVGRTGQHPAGLQGWSPTVHSRAGYTAKDAGIGDYGVAPAAAARPATEDPPRPLRP